MKSVTGSGVRQVAEYRHSGVSMFDRVHNSAYYVLFNWRLPEVPAMVHPAEVEQKVYAFYYPWYGSVEGPTGSYNHWYDVHPDGSIETSPRVPVFGAYDSRDPEIIEAQIDLARGASIDGFIASWYGPDSFEDGSFRVLYDVSERLGFPVAAYYECFRGEGGAIDVPLVVDELEYLIENYAGYNNYPRIDGKPLVFVYAVEAYGRLPDFWNKVRIQLEEKVGPVYLIGDFRNPAYLRVFDGAHFYNELSTWKIPGWIKSMEDSSAYLAGSIDDAIIQLGETGSVRLDSKLVCGTVLPGYDDTRVRDPGMVVDHRDGETLRDYYSLAEGQPWVLVTSWNEWHEGTDLEPSVELGSYYLDLLGKLVE